ncbi:AMP-binding protein, partial [Oceanobacillus massiliensis]
MNLSEKLFHIAKENPQKVAYIFQDRETTYYELEASVQRFASSLIELGYQKGDHIALVAGNSPHFIIGLYGALRAGAVVIPINPLYTTSELSYIIQNGDVKGIITMDVILQKFLPIAGELTKVEHYIICESGKETANDFTSSIIKPKLYSFTRFVSGGSSVFEEPKLAGEDLAIILYTSGTTGKPKGAMLTHKNLYSNAQDVANYLSIGHKDCVIAALPMFHVFCLTVALNAPLLNGGTII